MKGHHFGLRSTGLFVYTVTAHMFTYNNFGSFLVKYKRSKEVEWNVTFCVYYVV
jgi:hypothetical protein